MSLTPRLRVPSPLLRPRCARSPVLRPCTGGGPGGADFSAEKVAHTTGITYVVTGTYRTRGPYPLSFPYSCTANSTADGFTVVTGINGLGR
jgi:hypothetical protein